MTQVIADLLIVTAVWTAVMWMVRLRRARLAANSSPRVMRTHRLHTAAMLCVAVGVTSFVAWLMSDTTGPHWLHTLSLPTALVFIGGGAVLSGYAGWVGGL